MHTGTLMLAMFIEAGVAVGLTLLAAAITISLLLRTYRILSLPLRRREQARFFLDLLETGLAAGRSAEQTVVEVARCRETDLGKPFHRLAGPLEAGARLDQALDQTPRFLSTPMAAMLQAGSRLGDLRRVLPACRRLLQDGLSHTHGALNYLVLLVAFVLPVFPVMTLALQTFILPQLHAIANEMGVGHPTYLSLAIRGNIWIAALQIFMMGLLLLLILGYAEGPRLTAWMRRVSAAPVDRWLALWPWRRRRLQRDFANMLAVLLDAKVPEREALERAAACTGNRWFIQTAAPAAQRLAEGVPLPQALRTLGGMDELAWRLENAARSGTEFVPALAGWLDTLDAKAFQQEQAAAQLLTTGVVLINGVLVGLLAVAMFGTLLQILEAGILW